jgi:6-phosphofructokinase 2
MAEIVTLTMNPAVDVSVSTDRVVPEHKLRCSAPRLEPGGGGINVARAVHELGGQALALYLAGGATGTLLCELAEAAGIEHQPLPISGRTRQNLTVSETVTECQYRFVVPGPELRVEEWRRPLERLTEMTPPPRFVVASGSLPPGVPDDFYARLASAARDVGARTILDTSGAALRRGVEGRVYLVKPNLRELSQLADAELRNEEAHERAARALVTAGRAEVVVVSLGAAGVLLVTAEGIERIRAPVVPIRSKVGAGDSTVAGIVLALSRGEDPRQAAYWGVAAGAAAVMTPGTELCRRGDVERLYREMRAHALPPAT